ncbi:MAG TPA: DUF2127 domain-containing protein [Kofleriaceae bacterium]|jgi:uncharacterized membrane protein (DUF2068 family)
MLTLIGIFKLLKTTVLLAATFGFLKLVGTDPGGTARGWIADIGLDPNHGSLNSMLGKLDGCSIGKLEALSAGTFVYALLFLVEGIGLLRGKRWGEYLTIVITISFIPFEVYELAEKVSPMKIATLVVNIAIAIYLIVRVRQERRSD